MSTTTSTFPWTSPDFEGNLKKKGHLVQNWKQRWFILKGDKLWYFKSKENLTSPLGEILLSESICTTTLPERIKNKQKEYCFELTCGSGKVYYIQASSVEVMDSWMKAIRKGSCFISVSLPFDMEHPVHVDFNSDTGFVGLPPEWEAMLVSSQITKDEVIEHHDSIMAGMKFLDKMNHSELP